MSRLDDLIDLIRTTNEVYFITAPKRVRTAFILADDIVELALKTLLQERAINQRESFQTTLEHANIVISNNHRNELQKYYEAKIDLAALDTALGGQKLTILQTHISALTPNMLQHWSANDPADDFRTQPKYHGVVREVKGFYPNNPTVATLLDEAANRHAVRNKLYHDQRLSGFEISDADCLRALSETFDIMGVLFPDFRNRIKSPENKTVSCQMGVLKLKRASLGGQSELVNLYDKALEQLKDDSRSSSDPHRSLEHSLVHNISDRFFRALREQFTNTIAQHQTRIDEIGRMTRPQPKHQCEVADKQQLIQILQAQLNEINSLI